MHFMLISENELFHEIKRDGITSLHGIQVVLLGPIQKSIAKLFRSVQYVGWTY